MSLPSKSQNPSRVSSIFINPSDNSEVQLLSPPAESRPQIPDDALSTMSPIHMFEMMSQVRSPPRDAAHISGGKLIQKYSVYFIR